LVNSWSLCRRHATVIHHILFRSLRSCPLPVSRVLCCHSFLSACIAQQWLVSQLSLLHSAIQIQ
ncbi:hypothetical protein S245_051253, partial [Arachis hypogaea]